jgi:hypothetical protein
MKYLIGVVIGWFLHVHYSEQVLALFVRLTGSDPGTGV